MARVHPRAARLTTGAAIALIDGFLPRYDVRERHATIVRAPAERVYAALHETDLGEPRILRWLMTIRAIPAILAGGRSRLQARSRLTLEGVDAVGFAVLAQDPPRELVLGLEGSFWKPRGDLRPTSAAHFRSPPAPGTARAAWNFLVEPLGRERTRLSTETRVLASDAASRRSMRLYWLLIRPGSGLIRRAILRAIRRRAELRPAP